MVNDNIERGAGAGAQAGTPVQGQFVVPVIKLFGFGAGNKQFGQGMGAGNR